MIIKKFDYSKNQTDIFYRIIYPIFAKEFLFGSDYTVFAEMVQQNFILNSVQWEYILEHWNEKEEILKLDI